MTEPVDYRKPGTRDGEQAVNVKRLGDGSMAIGIHYPRKERIESCIRLAIGAGIAGALPIIGLFVGSWRAAVVGALFAVPALICLAEMFRNVVSLQEWMASHEGLTIVRHEPWGKHWRRFIPRSRISDVRVKFYRNTRASGDGGCDIRIRGRYLALLGPSLRGLGGDKLARVADAVREGLGLPQVDWPSGRVRRGE